MKYRNVLRKLAYIQHSYRQIMHKKAAWYNPISWFSGEDNSAYDVDALNAEIARIQEANPGMSRADARARAIEEDDKNIAERISYARGQYTKDMQHDPTDEAY